MIEFPQRRSIRLKDYDYSSAGAYFVTICVQNSLELYGAANNDGISLNAAGTMVEKEWLKLRERFPFLELDEFVVMPDHMHGILCLLPDSSTLLPKKGQGEHKVRPYGTSRGSVGRIIQAFKSRTTVAYLKGVKESGWIPFHGRLWQRGYYEHVIRNRQDLENVRNYIVSNPHRKNMQIVSDT